MPLMKTTFGRLPILLLLAPGVGFVGCANRGMETPTEPFADGLGGAASGADGSSSGGTGTASGGTVGAAGAAGGTGGSAGRGGSGAGPGAGGTSPTSTGGVGGGLGSGGTSSGGVVGTGGGVPTGGRGGAGAAGAGGSSTGGVAGGTAGQGGAGGLEQMIVSIDFVGGRPPTNGTGGAALVPAPAMAATETAGVKPAINWNVAQGPSGTLANLRASDAGVTSATVTWNSPAANGQSGEWTNAFTDAPGDVRMMNGYLDPVSSSSPATVKVSGLPAAITGGYDVYVYGYGDVSDATTRTYQYAIGSTALSLSQTGPSTPYSGFKQGMAGVSGDYVVLRKVSGASFTLTATPGTGSPSRAPINGIQIVWPSGS